MGWVKSLCQTLAGVATLAIALAANASGGWSIPGQAPKANEVEQPQVSMQLIAAKTALVPQSETAFAVVLEQKNGWHTYWLMPGDAGYPTRFPFTLPEGLSASAPLFPLPERTDTQGIVSYAYQGDTLFPFTVKVPATVTGSATIEVSAHYLACKEVCVPGEATARLTLPYDGQAIDTPDAQRITQAQKFIPITDQNPAVTATYQGKNLRISVPANTVSVKQSLAFLPLDANALFLGDPGQHVREADGSESVYLTLQEPFAQKPTDTLRGVLVGDEGPAHSGGWAMEVTIPLKAGTVARPSGAHAGHDATSAPMSLTLMTALIFALLGGLILNLMPCVFPVLSLKILQLVEGSRKGDPMLPHGIAFTLGVLCSMLILSGALLLLRSFGLALGWGFQLQSPWVVCALLFLFVGITLNLLGLYEFTFGSQLSFGGNRPRSSRLNSFFTGILAVIVASPCTAPFMGAALGFALTLPAVQATGIFLALGLGMALPWLALCLFPSWTKCLPKPGAWMNVFRRVMAIPMLGAALWLAWVLMQQLSSVGLGIALLGVLIVVALCVLVGRQQWGKGRHNLLIGATSIASLAVVALIGSGLFATQTTHQNEGSWQAWSPEAVQAALDKHQPVFIDFTAAWCITCQANKMAALNRAEVQAKFNELGYTRFEGDWTNYDERITKELERFKRSGVPLYLIYRPDGEVVVLPELLTPSIVIDALEKNAKP